MNIYHVKINEKKVNCSHCQREKFLMASATHRALSFTKVIQLICSKCGKQEAFVQRLAEIKTTVIGYRNFTRESTMC